MTDQLAIRQRKDRNTILLLLGVAAALPLLGPGMFAGAILATMVAVWLLRSGSARIETWPAVMALAVLVLIENVVFVLGFFGALPY